MELKRLFSAAVACLCAVSVFCACDDSSNSSADKPVEQSKNYSDMTSSELVKDMTLGYNLGDTLDVCQADRDGDGQINEHVNDGEKVDETLWGNKKATKKLFETIKKDGFNAVRIPVTWRDHMGKAPDYKIDEDWMARVKEVVDYAYDLDMYVIINLHHDGGGDPEFGAWIRTEAMEDYDKFLERYSAVWNQIAETFKDYDERLIFESMNEVGFDELGDSDGMILLNKINQDFVDLIRKSGGKNETRHLLIAGYWTDIEKTCYGDFELPNDPQNRCIVSIHYYTPWQFCTTNQQTEWGSKADLREMDHKIDLLKSTFTDKGIPVIIGEYGTGYGNEAKSKAFFSARLTYLCRQASIPCFLWDNGGELDRETYEFKTPGLKDALQNAIENQQEPTKAA